VALAPVEVTLVDRRNHQLFQPLLYQVAMGSLEFRRQRNVDVILGDVDEILPEARRIRLRGGDGAGEKPRTLSFDYLILATGGGQSYFGHDEYAQYAPGLKTLGDALEIRRRVLLAFELADRETDPEARQARILLVEGGPHVLPHYPPVLSASAERQLRGLGVEVRTGAIVRHIDDRAVTIGDERIAARTILWAAGVAASPLARQLGVPLDRHGRVEVSADLRVPGSSCVFVIGDLTSLESRGVPVPGVAPAAMQEGRHAAKNIRRLIAGRETLPFRYWSVHLFYLVGIRRRLVICLDWIWSYFSRTRSARVITETAEEERARSHHQLPAAMGT
jgi:NADH dehydrogenase